MRLNYVVTIQTFLIQRLTQLGGLVWSHNSCISILIVILERILFVIHNCKMEKIVVDMIQRP